LCSLAGQLDASLTASNNFLPSVYLNSNVTMAKSTFNHLNEKFCLLPGCPVKVGWWASKKQNFDVGTKNSIENLSHAAFIASWCELGARLFVIFIL